MAVTLQHPPGQIAEDAHDAKQPRLKVLVVDDHSLVRDGLKLTLLHIDAHAHVLEADTVSCGVDLYRRNPDIDLVLLDLSLPGTSGMVSLEAFYAACPDARVVVVSATYVMQTVQAAVTRGVLGFIPKRSSSADLLSALRFVLSGGIYVPRETFFEAGGGEASMRMGPQSPRPKVLPASPQSAGLTIRQIGVLRLLLEGKANKEICREMNLALGTVKSHVGAILQALEATTRAQAVAAVDRLGWRSKLADPS